MSKINKAFDAIDNIFTAAETSTRRAEYAREPSISSPGILVGIFRILSIIGAILGGITLLSAFDMTNSAPQQAAAGAVAAACAIVPYVIFRALQAKHDMRVQQRSIQLLESILEQSRKATEQRQRQSS